MAFNVENGAGVALEIDDLGITLELGEITDLAVRGDPSVIAISSVGAGDEIYDLVAAGSLIIKDPFDGVTNLSVADGLACIQSTADPHWRLGQGARIGDISDVALTSPVADETLIFNGTNWVNTPGGGGFSGLGIWRYRTAITATPTSGQLQLDNVTIDSATELYVNVINDDGTDMSAFLALITSGSLIYIQIQNDSSQFVAIEVGTSSLLSGVYTFPITTIEAQGTAPINNTRVAVVASGSGGGGGGGTDEQVKISANDTTAGFLNGKIVITTDETSLTEINDGGNETLAIGIADNPVLPGTASTTLQSGTTAQRPAPATNGDIRYNTDLNILEAYVDGSWIAIGGAGPGSYTGSLHAYHFLVDKYGYGTWLGSTSKHVPSDETPYLMPYACRLVALTYSANITSDMDIFIETAAAGAGSTNSTLFNWTVTGSRVARISTTSLVGGPGGLAISKGSKLAVFTDGNEGAGDIPPNECVVSVYVQWVEEVFEEASEAYAGDFA